MIDEDLYPEYCKHNNPIHYPFCVGCRLEREKKQKQRYEEYLKNKYKNKRFDPYRCEWVDEDLTSEITLLDAVKELLDYYNNQENKDE